MKEEEILLKYKNELGHPLLLSKREELKLIKRFKKGDQEAAKILIQANGRRIIGLALKYLPGHKLRLLDLIQEGNIGFLKGAKRFKPGFDCRLYTYAVWWIRQAMVNAIYAQGNIISIPRRIIMLINKFFKIGQELFNKLGYEPSLEQVALEIGVSAEKMKKILEYSKIKKVFSSHDFVKDKKNNPSKKRFLDRISDTRKNPEELTIINELKNIVRKKISTLSKREWEIIKKRFQIGIIEKKTLDNLGQRFGVTRERIRQIEASILEKLHLDAKEKNEKLDDYI